MKPKYLGSIGENVAQHYLLKNKYKIIECNYVCPIGEIDIICKYKNIIVFVEVKTRKTNKFGLPREAVTQYKQNKIHQIALFYLKINNMLKEEIRFDVIEILGEEITHLIGCF